MAAPLVAAKAMTSFSGHAANGGLVKGGSMHRDYVPIMLSAGSFSRQGLAEQETLKRTNDALMLAKLTDMEVKDAVDSLTTTISAFRSVTLT